MADRRAWQDKWVEESPICECHSGDDFLKVHRTALPIGKVLFSFVKRIEGAYQGSVDCYLDIDEAYVLCQDILAGQFVKGSSYKSPLGGMTEEEAGRADGKAISRQFFIKDAEVATFRFEAMEKPAHTNRDGLIIPEKGVMADLYVTVPVMLHKLRLMAAAIKRELDAFTVYQYVSCFDSCVEAWDKARDERKKGKGGKKRKETSTEQKKSIDLFYDRGKGCFAEKRGNGNNAPYCIRMITHKLSEEASPLLDSDHRFQLVDVIIYLKNLSPELRKAVQGLQDKIDGQLTTASLRGVMVSLGEIRDGYQQVILKG